jgi:hypothetical protein
VVVTLSVTDHREPWTASEVQTGTARSVRIGPLELGVKRTAGEWWVSTYRHEGDDNGISVPSQDEPMRGEARHWVATPGDERVAFEPAMPDRPLVVRPEAPLTMLPGQEALFFIGIPLWVRVLVGRDREHLLCDVPAVVLSNSWFGTTTVGELCYASRTTARRDPADIPLKTYRAVCPLTVRNSAEEPLDIARLCLRPQYLQLFEGRQHLWTSEGRVTYRGRDQWSRVVYSRKPPRFEPEANVIGQPREKPMKGFLARSILTIRGFADDD